MALSVDALNVLTAVKYDKETIDAVNKMTFLFDPNWQGQGNTLPIAFFYVKDMKEIMESEVSTKPLLFYNSKRADNPDSVAGGLLGVVADNVVTKPKQYQMEVIIPRNLDTYFKQSMFSKRISFGDLYQNDIMKGVDLYVNTCVELVTNLIKALNLLPLNSAETEIDLKSFVANSLSGTTDDSNKESLEAMWENRTMLRMKYWNGWKFKYVVITNFIPAKKGDEDNVFQATLNVVELPILTTRQTGSNIRNKLQVSSLSTKIKTAGISALLDTLESNTAFNRS